MKTKKPNMEDWDNPRVGMALFETNDYIDKKGNYVKVKDEDYKITWEPKKKLEKRWMAVGKYNGTLR